MKNLFLLDGLAGTGKSDCIKYIREDYNGQFEAGILQKYTTRQKRSEEYKENHKIDLEFITEEEFKTIEKEENGNFFSYEYGGKFKYGVKKSDIDLALEKYQDVFLIIRNYKCIKDIMRAYEKSVNVVPVFIYTDPYLVSERLRREGYSDEAIKFRTERSKKVWDEYLSKSMLLYKDIIINNSNPNDFHKFIDQLMAKYDQEEKSSDPAIMAFPCGDIAYLGRPLVGHRCTIDKFLEGKDYSKNVFLMVKYRNNNLDLRNEIKKRIEQKGFNCIIANEKDLTHDIYNPIALTYCCKYGIALFDKPEKDNMYSPNVAYELGIMQSQGKLCLVIKDEKLRGKNFFDILKDDVQWYFGDLQACNIIESFIDKIGEIEK